MKNFILLLFFTLPAYSQIEISGMSSPARTYMWSINGIYQTHTPTYTNRNTGSVFPRLINFPVANKSDLYNLTAADGLEKGLTVFNLTDEMLAFFDGSNWKNVKNCAASVPKLLQTYFYTSNTGTRININAA